MRFREDVKIEGIPITWHTNLSDTDLLDLYFLLRGDWDFQQCGAKVIDGGLRIQVYEESVEFKDGYCFCVGCQDCVLAVYRTHGEWRVWKAHRQELGELEDEQERKVMVDVLLFCAEDDDLRLEIELNVAGENYDAAAELMARRLALRSENKTIVHRVSLAWQFPDEAIRTYARFPTADHGIEYLRVSVDHPIKFTSFADAYLTAHQDDREHAFAEIKKVFRAATEEYPQHWMPYKDACLFWQRHGLLGLATEYCELAIRRELTDDTKTGFEGRLERLRRKAQQQG